jgi:F-type H+-transporting ATPase subunit b
MVLFSAAAAFASDGDQSPGMNLFYRVLNIGIFIAVLYKFVGKRAADFFGGRREGIRAEMEKLEAAKLEAEQRLAAVRKDIADLDGERRVILEESRARAEQIKAAVLEEARRQADRIREQALRAAENERKLALEQLRAELADEVANAAEVLLQSRLDAALHDKLINNSLTKVVLN